MSAPQLSFLIFIHGLNTYGDDLLHVGPLTFGPMHLRIEKKFLELARAQGAPVFFIPVLELGAGSAQDQALRAESYLKSLPLFNEHPTADIHLLGQSTGGLVARVLASESGFRLRIKTVLTFGTPHHGTSAADFALAFEKNFRQTAKVFSLFGYDTQSKANIFQHFTPAAMADFNIRYVPKSGVRTLSLICAVPRALIPVPLRLFYRQFHSSKLGERPQIGAAESDGFITTLSQSWGETRGPYGLDHFAELGFFLQTSARQRKKAASEFSRLLETVLQVVSDQGAPTVDEEFDRSSDQPF
jgi:hypothetical protein